MIKILQLNKLTTDIKEKLYGKLLNDLDWSAQLDLYIDNKYYTTPTIKFYNNDLCVSDFGKNFYFRTKKAVNNERYKNFGLAITNLKRLMKNRGEYVSYSNLRIYYKRKNVFNIEL